LGEYTTDGRLRLMIAASNYNSPHHYPSLTVNE